MAAKQLVSSLDKIDCRANSQLERKYRILQYFWNDLVSVLDRKTRLLGILLGVVGTRVVGAGAGVLCLLEESLRAFQVYCMKHQTWCLFMETAPAKSRRSSACIGNDMMFLCHRNMGMQLTG